MLQLVHSQISDPLDAALRTRFICSVNNEAVLKSLFKIKDDELNFNKAIHVAQETEDAARVAKETVYGKQPRIDRVAHQQEKKTIKRSIQLRQFRQAAEETLSSL